MPQRRTRKKQTKTLPVALKDQFMHEFALSCDAGGAAKRLGLSREQLQQVMMDKKIQKAMADYRDMFNQAYGLTPERAINEFRKNKQMIIDKFEENPGCANALAKYEEMELRMAGSLQKQDKQNVPQINISIDLSGEQKDIITIDNK